MSRAIWGTTLVALAVPTALVILGLKWNRFLMDPATLVIGIYAWIWLRFRPRSFIVAPDVLEIVWPARRRQIKRATITDVRVLDAGGLRRLAGFGMRVGAGGLWGGFGWLWTARRGIVQMYVSRTDGLVWIERGRQRPWLITPEDPEAFVQELSQKLRS